MTVSVADLTHARAFEFAVDPAAALDAFHHPFAYAGFNGIPFDPPLRAHDEETIAA